MKKLVCCVILCMVSLCLLLSGCQNTPNDDATVSIKTDDSVWYSEAADLRGRLWIGMTEKEVYDVLNEYDIPIKEFVPDLERDEYGAHLYNSPDRYYPKFFYTEGHQYFYFDREDRLREITYFAQMHPSSDPINEEFKAQRGVQRYATYDDMTEAYGEADQVVTLDDTAKSYVYRLENGDYLHFVYDGVSDSVQSISYCAYPYLFSY